MKKYLANLCWLSLLCSPLVFAFELINKNETEKVFISSQTADLDRSKGIGIYRVDVQIDQGTTHVRGEEIITYADENNKLKEAIIKGKDDGLAQYETIVEEGKPVLYAKAKIIKYYPQKKYIILLGQASITQGTDSIQGEKLEYDVDKQRLIASGGDTPQKGRTTIVIMPKSENGGLNMQSAGKKS